MPIELDDLKELLFAMETRLQKNMDERFEQVDKRFDAVDKRFEEVDQRFDAIDNRFEEVDQRFDSIENQLEQVDVRFDQLELSLLGKMDVIAKQAQQNSMDIHHITILMTVTERQLKIHSVQLTKLSSFTESRQKQAQKKPKTSRSTHRFRVIHSPHPKPRKEE